MGSWNYRVIKYEDAGGVGYGIVEAHYNDKKEIFAHSEDAIIYSESIEGLNKVLSMISKDINNPKAPILEHGKVEFAKIEGMDDEDLA